MAILKIPAKRSRVKPRPSDFGDPLEMPNPELDPKSKRKRKKLGAPGTRDPMNTMPPVPGTRDNMDFKDDRRLEPRKKWKA